METDPCILVMMLENAWTPLVTHNSVDCMHAWLTLVPLTHLCHHLLLHHLSFALLKLPKLARQQHTAIYAWWYIERKTTLNSDWALD